MTEIKLQMGACYLNEDSPVDYDGKTIFVKPSVDCKDCAARFGDKCTTYMGGYWVLCYGENNPDRD